MGSVFSKRRNREHTDYENIDAIEKHEDGRSLKRGNGIRRRNWRTSKHRTEEGGHMHVDDEDSDRIAHMAEAFQPVIQELVNVMDILPHFDFLVANEFSPSDTPKEAVSRLIAMIQESDARGKWQALLNALDQAGYEYVAQLLKGETEADHVTNRMLLRLFTPSLMHRIEPHEFIDHLYEMAALNDRDKEEVQCECRNRGDIAASYLLLQKVPRRNPNWYPILMQVLVKCGMDDVVDQFNIPFQPKIDLPTLPSTAPPSYPPRSRHRESASLETETNEYKNSNQYSNTNNTSRTVGDDVVDDKHGYIKYKIDTNMDTPPGYKLDIPTFHSDEKETEMVDGFTYIDNQADSIQDDVYEKPDNNIDTSIVPLHGECESQSNRCSIITVSTAVQEDYECPDDMEYSDYQFSQIPECKQSPGLGDDMDESEYKFNEISECGPVSDQNPLGNGVGNPDNSAYENSSTITIRIEDVHLLFRNQNKLLEEIGYLKEEVCVLKKTISDKIKFGVQDETTDKNNYVAVDQCDIAQGMCHVDKELVDNSTSSS